MIYEVLVSKRADHERGRFSDDRYALMIRYRDGEERPERYTSYESFFKGSAKEAIAYLARNSANWGALPLPTPLPLSPPSLTQRFFAFFGM